MSYFLHTSRIPMSWLILRFISNVSSLHCWSWILAIALMISIYLQPRVKSSAFWLLALHHFLFLIYHSLLIYFFLIAFLLYKSNYASSFILYLLSCFWFVFHKIITTCFYNGILWLMHNYFFSNYIFITILFSSFSSFSFSEDLICWFSCSCIISLRILFWLESTSQSSLKCSMSSITIMLYI